MATLAAEVKPCASTHSQKKQIEASPTRPPIRPPCMENVPFALRDLAQWVLWSYEKARGRPGWTKVPFRLETIQPKGRPHRTLRYSASSTDPKTWTDYESVTGSCASMEACGEVGAGLVLTADDPLLCIDLDECRDRDTGVLTTEAAEIVRSLDSYTEVSPSGTGLKIFVRATKPGERCKHTAAKIEVYDRARFVAVTGVRLPGTPEDVAPRQGEIDALYAMLFPAPVAEPTSTLAAATPRQASSPCAAPSRLVDLSDAAIVDRASNAANGAKFDLLYRGDTSHYRDDASAADAALASLLAFWTRDAGQIIRIMWSSDLRRDKWHQRKGYLDTTVAKALANGRAHYGDGAHDAWADELASFVARRVELIEEWHGSGSGGRKQSVAQTPVAAAPTVAAAAAPAPPAPPAPAPAPAVPDQFADLARYIADPDAPALLTPYDAIAAAYWSRETNPCTEGDCIGLETKDDGTPIERIKRCGHCAGCHAFRTWRGLTVLTGHMTTATRAGRSLFLIPTSPGQWQHDRKQIAHYSPRDEVDGYLHFADFAISTSAVGEQIGLAAAVERVRTALSLCERHSHVADYTTSESWELPKRPEQPSRCRFRAKLDMATEEVKQQIADNCGAEIRTKSLPDGELGDTISQHTYVRRHGWTKPMREYFWSQRIMGDAFPREEASGPDDWLAAPAERNRTILEADLQLVE